MVRKDIPELESTGQVWIYTIEYWREGDRDPFEYGPFASHKEAQTVFLMFKSENGGRSGTIIRESVPKLHAVQKLKHPYLDHGEVQAKAIALLGW